MRHPDPDRLALAALPSEPEDPEIAGHLRGCGPCRRHVESLRRTVRLARDGSPDAASEVPPERVWDAIAAEIGTEGAGPRAVTGPAAPPHRRRARLAVAVAVAAAVGLLAGGVAGAALTRPAADEVVASAPFSSAPDGATPVTGTVSMTEDGVMRVEIPGIAPAPAGSYYEVWLGDATMTEVVGVGGLRTDEDGAHGTLTLPTGVPDGRFGMVDVSVQPLGGDGSHSGLSVLRARLP
ncbi:anti-sigma factor domain-containing protein [Pseudonocardia alni]|uniref:anti-sigma factor n=1 Tax=Pseudonocardia alni TaxID=33907 RepID=UPI00279F6B2A|nr:anti-sigma factor [Pseudonocardia alni]